MWDSFTGSNPGTKEPDRLRLTVSAETPTEGATLRIFKRRMGIQDTMLDGAYGQLVIEEPDTAPIDAALAQMNKHQVHGAQVPDILPEGEAR